MQAELNLDDVDIREAPFSVKGVQYVIREPSADAGAWRRSKLIENTTVETVPDGQGGHTIRPKGLATGTGEIELGFLSRCVFMVNGDGKATDENVAIDVVRQWPDRVVNRLIQWAKSSGEVDTDLNPTKPPNNKLKRGAIS